jgi:hypothetical protein
VRADQGDAANIFMYLRPSDDHFEDASGVFGRFDHGVILAKVKGLITPLAHHRFLISANLTAAGSGMAAVGAILTVAIACNERLLRVERPHSR